MEELIADLPEVVEESPPRVPEPLTKYIPATVDMTRLENVPKWRARHSSSASSPLMRFPSFEFAKLGTPSCHPSPLSRIWK